ncbi:MAG: hypothetical protein OEV30_13580, partial [Ignavibacteria bacterium]|nr:hypothetical protein [Ignavibacteria bacterium]
MNLLLLSVGIPDGLDAAPQFSADSFVPSPDDPEEGDSKEIDARLKKLGLTREEAMRKADESGMPVGEFLLDSTAVAA